MVVCGVVCGSLWWSVVVCGGLWYLVPPFLKCRKKQKIKVTYTNFQNMLHPAYHVSLALRWSFFLPKQSQKSRSILEDGSRSLGLLRRGKTRIITKFHRTDLVIYGH